MNTSANPVCPRYIATPSSYKSFYTHKDAVLFNQYNAAAAELLKDAFNGKTDIALRNDLASKFFSN